MPRLMIALFSLFLLFNITLSAQETDTENIITISYTINSIPETLPETFLAGVANELESYGIELEFVDTRDEAQIYMRFDVAVEGEVIYPTNVLQIWLQTNLLKEISPLLYPTLSIITEIRAAESYSVDFATALILYATDDCESANLLFNDIVTPTNYLEENVPDAYFYQGACNLIAGEYETAITNFSEVYQNSEGDYWSSSTTNSAWAYIQLGREDEAFELMNLVLESREFWSRVPIETLVNRAQLYALVLDYDLAIADMDTAIGLAEENLDQFTPTGIAELYVLRGQMVILLYEWDRVLENYNTALEIAPDYTPAYFYRGILYYSILAREEALADFETYLSQSPDGEYEEQAQTYAESIRTELNALDD